MPQDQEGASICKMAFLGIANLVGSIRAALSASDCPAMSCAHLSGGPGKTQQIAGTSLAQNIRSGQVGMLGVASASTGHLCWEGGGVQAEDPVSGANDGHVTADALQMSVQPRQLRRHQLLHGATTAGFSNHRSGVNSQRTTAESHNPLAPTYSRQRFPPQRHPNQHRPIHLTCLM